MRWMIDERGSQGQLSGGGIEFERGIAGLVADSIAETESAIFHPAKIRQDPVQGGGPGANAEDPLGATHPTRGRNDAGSGANPSDITGRRRLDCSRETIGDERLITGRRSLERMLHIVEELVREKGLHGAGKSLLIRAWCRQAACA
jgi:hypothetical protein